MSILTSNEHLDQKSFPFSIRKVLHAQDNAPPVHGHDFVELIYVIYGEAKHFFEGQLNRLCAGDVFIINPGEVHTYHIEKGKQIEIVNCLFLPELIQDTWLKALGITQSMDYFYVHPFLKPTERFHHCLNLRGKASTHVLHLLEGMHSEYEAQQSGYSTLIRLKLVELLICLSRYYTDMTENAKPSPYEHDRQMLIRRMCGFLDRHHDQKITTTTLAELFNVSTRQLGRVFKEETGMTIVEMIHSIRIEKAKYLLDQTDDKVIHIANKVGYEDQAFFSRLFRRLVGVSPGKYRAQGVDGMGQE
ncbi:AraC family transcriptional regulator [Aureibacillus halotolerans]|uniref:AraC-like DNA-binding protein n=1 Tax=Aureibacillus halotolerans TaxID=1508390 RepID=A0A4R6U5F5_9BACI|nr:AraC family transcriptional regulator [Aureibacillus halotolerans]TDQ40772.1 AraC-like DNA-binding protein [Aureibacillus halotolerans]